jgi:hypothetical protein
MPNFATLKPALLINLTLSIRCFRLAITLAATFSDACVSTGILGVKYFVIRSIFRKASKVLNLNNFQKYRLSGSPDLNILL